MLFTIDSEYLRYHHSFMQVLSTIKKAQVKLTPFTLLNSLNQHGLLWIAIEYYVFIH